MNNEPAFPTSNWQKIAPMANGYNEGMTLRDYFAAKAMQGYISAWGWHPNFVFPTDSNFDDGKRDEDAVAVSAYKWADAMLKAREA